MRTFTILAAVFISVSYNSGLSGQAPIVLPASTELGIRTYTPEVTREMIRVHKYHGLDPTVASRFESALNGLSIVRVLDAVRENLELADENALAISNLVQKRKAEIDAQLNAVWRRLSGSEPADDLIENELTVLITHETIEENKFLAEIEGQLSPKQHAILLKELSRDIGFANFIYCVQEYKLTPHQRSLFNNAGRAILPSTRKSSEQTDQEYHQKFHAAMDSLSKEQFERVAKAKGIFPPEKTLREFYLDEKPERQKILADNVKWFAEIRAESER